jgi:nitroreductase
MDMFDAIKGRRSVRKYKPDPISDQVISELIDAARWAPSWANLQCARYVVVKDKAVREKLLESMTPKNPARDAVANAPVTVAFIGKIDASGYKGGQPFDDKGWYMFDVGMAMQNFCLAAHAKGLGTVVVGAFDYKAAGKALNVPEGYQVVAFTPLGYPDGEAKAPARKEMSELMFREKM